MAPILGDINLQNPSFQGMLVVMGILTLYIAVVRPAMKKNKDPLAKTPSMNSLAQQRNVERQMQNLLVQLSEMARQITAQLDTRAQKLMMLIQDADERIIELKKLENQPLVPPGAPPSTPRSWAVLSDVVPRNIPIPDPVDDQHQPVYALADQGRSATDIARELNRPRGEIELILALRPAAQST